MLDLSFINPENEMYVDLDSAVEFESKENSRCLTIIESENSIRIRLDKNLFEEIGSPEAVKVLFKDNIVIFHKTQPNRKTVQVKKHGLIYNSELARKIMKISDEEFKGGSTKIGKYHLQKLKDDTVAAVVSFA